MKRIIIILIILIAFLLVITYFQNKNIEAGLIIKYGETELVIPNLSEYQSSKIETKRGDNYLGFSLMEIVNNDNFKKKEFTLIIFKSSDGGSLAVNIEELNNLYLVEDSRNEENFIRLVIPTDDFSQRWMKYICEIEFAKD